MLEKLISIEFHLSAMCLYNHALGCTHFAHYLSVGKAAVIYTDCTEWSGQRAFGTGASHQVRGDGIFHKRALDWLYS